MTALRDKLLPVVDRLRVIPTTFGLRRYLVAVRVRTWSGPGVGEGVATDVDTQVTPTPRVRVMSSQEVASSGGTFRQGDFEVAPITPKFVTGGYAPGDLDPRPGGITQEVIWLLTGDEGTVECSVVTYRFDRPFRTTVVLRERRTAVGTTLG